MSLFFAPNHVKIIEQCYPPSSALVAPGADCQPLTQELSKLTYYASNKADVSGKLAKLGSELEKRAVGEARKARTGHQRTRGQLLVTLSILKALANECRKDVSLLTKSIIISVKESLTCLPNDLEVQARAASVFIAWATYTDGRLIGVDPKVTSEYLNTTKLFCDLCGATGKDSEQVNRIRLVGLAVLSAVVASDAFFHSVDEFKRQTTMVIPALLKSLHEAGTQTLTNESSAVRVDRAPNSPYLSEFQPRPVAERRAASIHIHHHVDGEKGPELHDVVNACLRALRTLLGRCTASQISIILMSILAYVDHGKAWPDIALCTWYAERVTDWSQYQYRFTVPTKLVEELVQMQDASKPTPKHHAIIAMITHILSSPSPLINLATTELIGKLSQVLLRRIPIDPQDELIEPMVGCISALGTHMYYADQIQDLAEELVSRIVSVQLNGLYGKGRQTSDKIRESALCSLLACLSGLTEAADRNAAKAAAKLRDREDEQHEGDSRVPSESTTATVRQSRRNKISPESWQETLALLCESNYRVRATYTSKLKDFVGQEIKREPFVHRADEPDAVCRTKVIVDPLYKASSRPSILVSDPTSRFLNALHGSIFTLLTAHAASQNPPTSPENEEPLSTNGGPVFAAKITPPSNSNLPSQNATQPLVSPLDTKVAANGDTSIASSNNQSPAISPTEVTTGSGRHRQANSHGRKLSLAMSLLDPNSSTNVPMPTLSDYALILDVMLHAHWQVPCRALLTGVPMLLALDTKSRSGKHEAENSQRNQAIQELLCYLWITVAYIWDAPEIRNVAERALGTLQPHVLPSPERLREGEISIQSALEFPVQEASSNIGTERKSLIDPEVLLPALASSNTLQAVTGLDRQGLLRRFTVNWSIEIALKDSVERVSSQDILRGEASHLKLSPALMHIENLSLASIARSGPAVGASDLRDALSGRGSMSNPALASAASFSTNDHKTSVNRQRQQRLQAFGVADGASSVQHPAVSRIKRKGKGQPNEVRDVLNKLGIGKQTESQLMKTPYSTIQRAPSIGKQKSEDKQELMDDTKLSSSPPTLSEPPY